MSITQKAAIMADEGFAPEDIAVVLDTTPEVVRTVLDRKCANGVPVRLRLPDDVHASFGKRAEVAGCSVKTLAQMILIEEIRERGHAPNA